MTDTTTIEITKAQKAQLDELKTGSKESYKDVLQRLIDGYDTDGDDMTEATVRSIANEQITERVVPEAQR
jgi:predicted CopG family antitoxin